MRDLKHQGKSGLKFGKSFLKVVMIKVWPVKRLSLWVFSKQTIDGQKDDMRDFTALSNNEQL